MASRRAKKDLKKSWEQLPMAITQAQKKELDDRKELIEKHTFPFEHAVGVKGCKLCNETGVSSKVDSWGRFKQCKCIRVTKTEQLRQLKEALKKRDESLAATPVVIGDSPDGGENAQD